MAKVTLERVIEEIKTWNLDELRQLRESVDTLLMPSDEAQKREALHQALKAAGLVTQTRQPRLTDNPDRPLIPVQGEPVSETILKERR
jgi:hypothetical protein